MSLESLMDTSKEIFKLDKEILTFKINSKNLEESSEPISIAGEEILVTNLTENYLALKIKTTKNKMYAVNPSYCIISPNEEKKINIILYKLIGEKLDPKKHKFQFEGIIILENEKEKDVKDLFNEYIKKGNKIVGNIQKISVKYLEIEEKEKENAPIEEIKKEEILKKNSDLNEEKNKEKLNDNNSKNVESELGSKISLNYFFIGVIIASLFIAIYLYIK